MSETLATVLRASVRTLAVAAGLSPSRMHQLGKLTVLQTLPPWCRDQRERRWHPWVAHVFGTL